mmetsp:Transcript_2074/g.5571  ORF Transcript_2074/g.5571 Transcript_2074/m.5571 type:complete len:368 (-) Transcript_2074:19-1122(-)
MFRESDSDRCGALQVYYSSAIAARTAALNDNHCYPARYDRATRTRGQMPNGKPLVPHASAHVEGACGSSSRSYVDVERHAEVSRANAVGEAVGSKQRLLLVRDHRGDDVSATLLVVEGEVDVGIGGAVGRAHVPLAAAAAVELLLDRLQLLLLHLHVLHRGGHLLSRLDLGGHPLLPLALNCLHDHLQVLPLGLEAPARARGEARRCLADEELVGIEHALHVDLVHARRLLVHGDRLCLEHLELLEVGHVELAHRGGLELGTRLASKLLGSALGDAGVEGHDGLLDHLVRSLTEARDLLTLFERLGHVGGLGVDRLERLRRRLLACVHGAENILGYVVGRLESPPERRGPHRAAAGCVRRAGQAAEG